MVKLGILLLFVTFKATGADVGPIALPFQDTLGNPFTFTMTGLPFAPSPCGNGEPLRISQKVAIAVIDSVFRAEGFNLQPALIETEKGYVAVTGYDSLHKIGYVWLEWRALDDDLCVSYNDYARGFDGGFYKIPHIRSVDRFLVGKRYSAEKIYEALRQYPNPSANQLDFTRYLKQAIDSGQTDWREEYKWAYYEYCIKEILANTEPSRMSPKLKRYLNKTLEIKNLQRKRQRIETVLDMLDIYSYASSFQMGDILLRAAKTKTPKENFARIAFMYKLTFMYQHDRVYPERNLLLWEGINGDEEEWKRVAAIAQIWWDKLKVSRQELTALEEAAERGDFFIAPISFRDERLIYRTTEAGIKSSALNLKKHYDDLRLRCESLADDTDQQEAAPKLWERCEWLFQNQDVDDINRLTVRIRKNNGITQEEVLEKLAEQTQGYIQWAKQQQGH